MGVPRPDPCFLDSMAYLGFKNGQQRRRSSCERRIYTWDGLHGEIEVFNPRGKHIGVIHAVTGDWIKDAVKRRSIDVK